MIFDDTWRLYQHKHKKFTYQSPPELSSMKCTRTLGHIVMPTLHIFMHKHDGWSIAYWDPTLLQYSNMCRHHRCEGSPHKTTSAPSKHGQTQTSAQTSGMCSRRNIIALQATSSDNHKSNEHPFCTSGITTRMCCLGSCTRGMNAAVGPCLRRSNSCKLQRTLKQRLAGTF